MTMHSPEATAHAAMALAHQTLKTLITLGRISEAEGSAIVAEAIAQLENPGSTAPTAAQAAAVLREFYQVR